jgi:DNA-binding MarR family transcriptional regulator
MTNHEIIHELHQTVRYVTKKANERLKAHGLFQSQWAILLSLKRFGPMTQTDLWRYLNVEAPTVTRTLSKLEEKGWVIRRLGTDKRERIVYLTDKAREQLPSIEATIRAHEEEMLRGLTDEEQEQFLILLKKVGRSG